MTTASDRTIKRRDFLKLSGSVAALAVLGELTSDSSKRWFVNAKAESTKAQSDEWIYGYCRMCQAPQCGIRVKVDKGVVVKLEGNPDHPYNQGTLCPRGRSAIMNLYNPYRVKAPMKRTNPEKGPDNDPGWVEISWDEALATVADKLKPIMDSDPRGLAYLTGFGAYPDNNIVSWTAFPTQFGTPNSIHTNGPLCPVHYASMSTHGTFTDRVDLEYCDLLITVGSSVGVNWCDATNGVRELLNARERGMRFVAVDPRCGPEASLDQWVPILPGTEIAFLMGILNVILNEIKVYDEEFLKNRTNGIYLTLPEGGYLRDPETNKPLVWDQLTSTAKEFDDPSLRYPSLEADFQVFGQKVKTAFTVLKETMASASPEWAEGISSVPAQTIRDLAKELVEKAKIGSVFTLDGYTFPYRPVAVWAKRGAVAKRGGNYLHMLDKLINIVLGAMDVPGAMQGDFAGPALAPGPDGTLTPDKKLVPQAEEWIGVEWAFPPNNLEMSEYYPNKHSLPHLAWRAILDPQKYHLDYDVKAMVVHGANPLINTANMEEPIAAFKKIPFIVSIAYHFDEPTQMADIVLPESSNLEKTVFMDVKTDGKSCSNKTRGLSGVNVRSAFVDPIYNSRQSEDVLIELADRLGFLPKLNGMLGGMLRISEEQKLQPPKRYSWVELVEKSLTSKFGPEHNLDYFRKTGFLINNLPLKETYNYFYFPGPQTRIPIYFEHLWAMGERLREDLKKTNIEVPGWEGKMDILFDFYKPVPHWVDSHLFNAPAEYDMFVVNWKIPFLLFGLGSTIDNPWAQEIIRTFDPYTNVVCMNPKMAAQKGLKEKDRVEVVSQNGGKISGTLHLSELFHPQVVGIAGNFGRVSVGMNPIAQGGLNYNQLLGTSEETIDPVIGAVDNSARILVRKA
jgi:anaerobic selenocysteine-containing dehydrogenase